MDVSSVRMNLGDAIRATPALVSSQSLVQVRDQVLVVLDADG